MLIVSGRMEIFYCSPGFKLWSTVGNNMKMIFGKILWTSLIYLPSSFGVGVTFELSQICVSFYKMFLSLGRARG